MLSKNTCEGIHLIIKLPAISVQAYKFTKNEFLHTYFSKIFNGSGGGGGGGSDGGCFIFRWGCTPWGGTSVLIGGRFSKKNHRIGGAPPIPKVRS